MSGQIYVLIVVIVLCLLAPVSSDDGKQAIDKLTSKDAVNREKGYKEIATARAATIKKLIEHAGKDVKQVFLGTVKGKKCYGNPHRDSKHLSILLLGEYRAVEAIPVLMKNLQYKNPRHLATDYDRRWTTWYPAAEALAKIGAPALEKLLKELSEISRDTVTRKLCGNILVKILGKDFAVAVLKKHIAQVKSKQEKACLTGALKFVESWTKKDKWVDKK